MRLFLGCFASRPFWLHWALLLLSLLLCLLFFGWTTEIIFCNSNVFILWRGLQNPLFSFIIKTVRDTTQGGFKWPTTSRRPRAPTGWWTTPTCAAWGTPSSATPTVRRTTGVPAQFSSATCGRSWPRASSFLSRKS